MLFVIGAIPQELHARFYPNPADDVAVFSASGLIQQVQIFDFTGEIVADAGARCRNGGNFDDQSAFRFVCGALFHRSELAKPETGSSTLTLMAISRSLITTSF